jgi:hypothetical protein
MKEEMAKRRTQPSEAKPAEELKKETLETTEEPKLEEPKQQTRCYWGSTRRNR